MSAAKVLADLRAAGIAPALRDDGIAVPAGRLTDAQRQAIRQHKPELLALLQAEAANDPTPAVIPVLSLAPMPCEPEVTTQSEQGGSTPGARHAARMLRFASYGMPEDRSEALADRLAGRDAEQDDRRVCLECSYLGTSGQCLAAHTGRLIGAHRQLEPVPDILQRCEGFGLRKGLS